MHLSINDLDSFMSRRDLFALGQFSSLSFFARHCEKNSSAGVSAVFAFDAAKVEQNYLEDAFIHRRVHSDGEGEP